MCMKKIINGQWVEIDIQEQSHIYNNTRWFRSEEMVK